MRRTHTLVSSLLLLLGGSALVSAVEVGPPGSGLLISGWGEALVRAEHRDTNNPKNSGSGEDEDDINFSADALVKVAYNVDQFALRLDVFVTDEPQFDDDDNDGNNVILEQAFVDWKFHDLATLRAGRFRSTWIGWEGYHTPELFRVNNSAVWSWNVRDHGQLENRPFLSDGVSLTLTAPEDPLTLGFFIVDDVLGDAPDAEGTDLAYGINLTWAPPWLGQLELGAVYDAKSMTEDLTSGSDGAAIDFNVDITTWQDQGWFFAGEVQYHFHTHLSVAGPEFGDALMWLVMANYSITDDVSLTLMVDSVDRGLDQDDNEIFEVAFAVLTKPHKQAQLNFEVFHWDESAPNADAYGAAAVLLIELP